MPRVHRVKSARKDHPECGVKAGEPYYWWKHKLAYGGLKRCSKSYPRGSQLTLSDYQGAVLTLQESIEDYTIDCDAPVEAANDLEDALSGWSEEARDIGNQQRDKYDNLPENFQQGDTGLLLEERVDACEGWASEIENYMIPSRDDYENDDDFCTALEEAVSEIAALSPE
jgi:hypothetical protein